MCGAFGLSQPLLYSPPPESLAMRIFLLILLLPLTGCAVASVTSAVVSVAATTVQIGATVVGATVDVAAGGVKAVTGGSD